MTCATLILSFVVAALHAQPADSVLGDLKGKPPLRKVWQMTSSPRNLLRPGIAGIPDINGDSINEFAVSVTGAFSKNWHIFYGGLGALPTTPAVILRDLDGNDLLSGNFRGAGQRVIGGVMADWESRPVVSEVVRLYRVTAGTIDTAAPITVDPRRTTPATALVIEKIAAADLDGDRADDLVLLVYSAMRNRTANTRPEIWIYKGGAEFPADTPAVILHGADTGGYGISMVIGRWDADAYPDIGAVVKYPDRPSKLEFWFGGPGSPWNWSRPDRSVDDVEHVALDCDGDGVLDIAADVNYLMKDTVSTVGLFLSKRGKSIRTRSLALDDIDVRYHRRGFHSPVRLGYMGDSLRQFEMLGILGADDTGPLSVLGLLGGIDGPDHTPDVYAWDEHFNDDSPIPDVTGDGWNDWLCLYALQGYDVGHATLHAGGPYIPRDSTAAGVHDIDVAGVRGGLSIWPNPVRNEFHIAWRGDLHRFPARFIVHDMLGREIARGEMDARNGQAMWECASRTPGMYILSVYEANGALLAAARFVKE